MPTTNKGQMRKALRAPEGFKVVVADSGQIEARVLAWLAGHKELIAAFRAQDAAGDDAQEDVYTRAASLTFRRPVTKKNKLERSVGKFEVLGMGFGMGGVKAGMQLASGPLGAKPIIFDQSFADELGVNVHSFKNNPYKAAKVEAVPSRLAPDAKFAHFAVADFIVDAYRKSNAKIPELWDAMYDFLPLMAEHSGQREDDVQFGPLVFQRHSIRLPSGLALKYPGLREKTGENGRSEFLYQGGVKREKTERLYGGLLVENVVQALARIIVAEQMRAIEEAGYRIVMMAHDEVVCGVPDSEAQSCLELMLRTMKTPPPWAPDLPLNASGDIGQSYGDAK